MQNLRHTSATKDGAMIPKTYFNPAILSLVDLFISEGYQSYSDLPEGDQERLTATIIRVQGEDAYSCIVECEEFSEVIRLFSDYLLTGKKESAIDLAETMRVNAIGHYSYFLDLLFAERLDSTRISRNLDRGLTVIKDRQTGESIWVRA